MSKRELIEKIAEKSGLEMEEAEDFYFMFIKFIIDALKKREIVKIKDFGVFSIRETKKKKGRKIKEEINILFKPLGRFKRL